MKITQEHYSHMKTAIASLDIDQIKSNVIKDGKYKDFDKRVRWDCSYKAGLSGFICNNLYSYLNDSHIDTALKNIMKELKQ